MQTRKQKLTNRLKWYYPLERFHALFTFPVLAIYAVFHYSIQDLVFLLYGFVLIIFILWQGQQYWKLKLYRLTDVDFDEKKNLSWFTTAKKINVSLIAGIPVVFLLQWCLNDWNMLTNDTLGWAIVANTFGILEHINYYHTQLMVDNPSDFSYIRKHKKLKRASLAKDLYEHKL
ncbi:hypothetical protein [Cochleicola gelatinilyticus]|nr:hypothetical protein [Cochleicola gelatinilyticus]